MAAGDAHPEWYELCGPDEQTSSFVALHADTVSHETSEQDLLRALRKADFVFVVGPRSDPAIDGALPDAVLEADRCAACVVLLRNDAEVARRALQDLSAALRRNAMLWLQFDDLALVLSTSRGEQFASAAAGSGIAGNFHEAFDAALFEAGCSRNSLKDGVTGLILVISASRENLEQSEARKTLRGIGPYCDVEALLLLGLVCDETLGTATRVSVVVVS